MLGPLPGRAWIIVVVTLLACAPPALSCPICDGGTGRQVRAGIAGDGLAAAVAATVLPFALTVGIVAAVHFRGGGAGSRSPRKGGHGDA
jgi:hypothetical protein